MALRTLMLRNELNSLQAQLESLRSTQAGFVAREAELTALINAATDEDRETVRAAMDAFEQERSANEAAITEAEQAIAAKEAQIRAAEAAAANAAAAGNRSGSADLEQRAREFQRTGRMRYENLRSFIRAVLPNTAGVIGPTGVAGINDAANLGVSSFIDLIKVTDCTGMASYKVAYLSADGTAAPGTPGTAPTESAPTFGSVELTPSLVNILGYISREIRKQSPLQYEEKVRESARRALRRVLNGNAVTAVTASALNDTLAKTAAASATSGSVLFTPTLLSEIILAYGGDEAVDGAAYLVLNKADLKAFAAVRGTNEYLPVYSIVPDSANPNVGVIKDNNGLSCRYCLSNDVAALSSMTLTTSAKKSMFYGNPQCAEMGLWGDIEVIVNDGYKFGEGLLTIMGEALTDVDVTTPKGFVVVTAKKAST